MSGSPSRAKHKMNPTRLYAAPLAFAVSIASGFVVSNASAQPGGAPSNGEIDREQAQRLFNEGLKAIDRKDWRAAYDAYYRLWRMVPSADVAGLLGQSERMLGRCAAAIPHLEAALKDPNPDAPPDAGDRIQEWLADCRARVGEVRVSTLSGLDIFVDGAIVGRAPLSHAVVLDSGDHFIEVRRDGRVLDQRPIAVTAGSSQSLTLAEGSAGDVAPISEVAVAPSSPGVARDAGEPPSAPAVPVHKPTLVPAYVLGGIAVVGAAAAVTFRLLMSKDERDGSRLGEQVPRSGCYRSEQLACSELEEIHDRHEARGHALNASLIVGGAAAVGALGYLAYALYPRRPATVGVLAGPYGAFATIRGDF